MPTNAEIFGNLVSGPFFPPGGFPHGLNPEFRFFNYTRPEPPVQTEIPLGTPGSGAMPPPPLPAPPIVPAPPGGGNAAPASGPPGSSTGLGSEVNPGPQVVDARAPVPGFARPLMSLPAIGPLRGLTNIGIKSGLIGPFGVVDPEVTPPQPFGLDKERFDRTVELGRLARERSALEDDKNKDKSVIDNFDVMDVVGFVGTVLGKAIGFPFGMITGLISGLVDMFSPPDPIGDAKTGKADIGMGKGQAVGTGNDFGGLPGTGQTPGSDAGMGRGSRSGPPGSGDTGVSGPGGRGGMGHGPGDPSAPGGQPGGLHTGGLAVGPDPAVRGEEHHQRLLEGEFVFSPAATNIYGPDFLAVMNRIGNRSPELAVILRMIVVRMLRAMEQSSASANG